MEDEIESPPTRRFARTTQSERQDFLDSANSRRPLIAPQTWVKAFGAYCGHCTVDFHATSGSDLSEKLQGFYPGMREADGSEYACASFIAARSALAKHVTYDCRFDLIKGPKFKQAEELLDAMLKDKQWNGREPAVQHKALPMKTGIRSRSTSWMCSKHGIPGSRLSTHGLSSQATSAYVGLQTRLCKKGLLFGTSKGRESIQIVTDLSQRTPRVA